MLQRIVEFCTSDTGLFWIIFYSDLLIAFAYFAIPVTMAIVLHDRKDDIPYPWLWMLFVTFIVACGMTHVVHVWSVVMGTDYLALRAAIEVITVIASLGTAIAFAFVLPQIKLLPSPRQQTEQLQMVVAERTKEKDQLIREINHRIGNQLQILSSIVNIEARRARAAESLDILERLRAELDKMGRQHVELSQRDYLGTIIHGKELPEFSDAIFVDGTAKSQAL
jgi:hypothetical protein